MPADKQQQTRFNWNKFPYSKLQESYTGHVACHLSPCENTIKVALNQIGYVKCINLGCQAIMNKYCQINIQKRSWTCCICKTINSINDNISQESLDIFRNNGSFDFLSDTIIPGPTVEPRMIFNQKTKVYMYMIDLLTEKDELSSLKSSILESVSALPANSVVIVITYDSKTIRIHDSDTGIPHAFDIESPIDVKNMRNNLFSGSYDRFRINKYLYNLNDSVQLTNLQSSLNNLSTTNIEKPKGQRHTRITGTALQIAMELVKVMKLEILPILANKLSFIVNVLVFISGPCTTGAGKIISPSLKSNFRNHNVIVESFSELNQLNYAVKFYSDLIYANVGLLYGLDSEHRAFNKNCNISIKFDIFSANYDETGLFEMQNLCNLTGGRLILSDSFDTNIFKQNFLKVFPGSQNRLNYNGRLDILTSCNLKINGAIGPLVSLKNHSQYASDLRIGESLTNSWLINSFQDTNFTVFFQQEDFIGKKRLKNDFYYVQFKLRYKNRDENFLKIITVEKKNGHTPAELAEGFDQVAYLGILAKKVVYDNLFNLKYDDLNEDLDLMFKNLIVEFGRVLIEEPTSVWSNEKFHNFITENSLIELNSKFNLIPEFFYYLKKSYIVRKFNITPDETSFYNNILLQSNAKVTRLIVNSSLYNVSVHGFPNIVSSDTNFDIAALKYEQIFLTPIPLDADALSISNNNIFIFDDFFHILIHYGSSISYYRDIFIKEINPKLRDKDLSSIDLDVDIKQPLLEFKAQSENQSTLNPIAYLIDTVDFLKIFQLIRYSKLKVLQVIRDPQRSVLPRYVETDENKSQARFLYARLSPADRYNDRYSFTNSTIISEEMSLNDYYRKICFEARISIERKEKM
ncbi:hypothetical protein DASC09_036030 [Saccharomycopsis crataegensis]|uniref:Protein transport protein SEC23 n=1 Tax=Saccharomycopsis crataegensis TaxID=43959 RepID=A0AAV5QNB8_9ASCO|nr:hypothetical protein DASC09_036030 [Saccharomycopsis crataegensis]